MTLTLQTVEAHIRNALGGDSSVEGNGRSIANQAGHYWATMHDWRCMERHARLNLRASITVSDGLWTEATRTLTDVGAFTNYTFVQGDEFQATAGTNATLGFYPVQSKTSSDAIVLATSIGSLADAQTDIDGTLTLQTVALPADFRQILHGPVSVDSTRALYLGNSQEVLDLQGAGGGFDTSYSGSIVWRASSAALGGPPVPVIELSGSPSENVSGAFRIHYRATWTDLTDDSDVVQIPSAFGIEMLYLQIVRAVALGYEEFDTASMQARLATIRGGPEFNDAIRADGTIQTNFGEARGGAVQRRSRGWWPSFTFLAPG